MKRITLIFAMIITTLSAIAQKGNTPAEYSGFTFLRTEYRGGDNFTDIYQDANGNLYEANMICPSCPKPSTPGVVVTTPVPNYTNTNTNINVDPAIEQQKIEIEKMKIQLAMQDLERQKAADKVAKRQGGWNTFANVLTGVGTAATGAGTIMIGDAAEKGKMGTNIFQTIFGSTITNPTDPGGPWMGGTTNTGTTNPVIIDNQGSPHVGGTIITDNDPRWNPLLGNTNNNGFFGSSSGPLSGATRRVIIN